MAKVISQVTLWLWLLAVVGRWLLCCRSARQRTHFGLQLAPPPGTSQSGGGSRVSLSSSAPIRALVYNLNPAVSRARRPNELVWPRSSAGAGIKARWQSKEYWAPIGPGASLFGSGVSGN